MRSGAVGLFGADGCAWARWARRAALFTPYPSIFSLQKSLSPRCPIYRKQLPLFGCLLSSCICPIWLVDGSALIVRAYEICLFAHSHPLSGPNRQSKAVKCTQFTQCSTLTTMSFFRHELGNLFSISSKIIVHHDAWVWVFILCGAVVGLTHFGGKFL